MKAVLFDLDGTLLPMDQDVFIKDYFGRLAAKMAPKGYDPQLLIKSVWTGTAAMVANDGSKTNEEVFWKAFTDIFGQEARKDEPVFQEYYEVEFQGVQASCGFNELAAKVVAKLKDKGVRVLLATNPLFPRVATLSRIKWAGLKPEDFEIITTYETSRYCKPNPDYYSAILTECSLTPSECLMVGNDVEEDILPTEMLGMKNFLLTDCLINKKETDLTKYLKGSFEDLERYIDEEF